MSWPERVGQHAQRAQRRVHGIQVFDLVEEIALRGWVELARPLALDQDFQEESEEIEILLRRWQRERIDLEISGFEAHANIRAAEQLREALEAASQIEDECVRIVFLEIGDEEIQQERLSRRRSARESWCGPHRGNGDSGSTGCGGWSRGLRDIPAGDGDCEARHE